MTRVIGPLCAGLAVGALTMGVAPSGWQIWMPMAGSLGLVWLIAFWRGQKWAACAGLAGSVCGAAAGLWYSRGTGWMVAGLVATLCAWDLHGFAQRLRSAGRVEGARALERRHLQRLLAVACLSLVAAVIALRMEIRLTFLVALLLALAAGWGLSRAVRFLRRETD